MKAKTEKFEFKNKNGETLAARLEWPEGPAKSFALFSHCFTCSKDTAAASRISKSLTNHGVAVVRFDFTGLGNSDGDFANTNFSSNISDLLCAVDHMREVYQAPKLIVGHSLGGAAALAVASEIPELNAVVTIGAPSEVGHVSHLFKEQKDEIEAQGEATVNLAGREFKIKKQFLDDIESFSMENRIASLRKAFLIMHSPQDNTVSIEHAKKLYMAAKHPKSFISLDGADHLLSKKEDSQYVADVIGAWSSRYMGYSEGLEDENIQKTLTEKDVYLKSQGMSYTQDIYTKDHSLVADEPISVGGNDLGMSPYQLLLSSLAACTSMTLQMYAKRKEWPLEGVEVKLVHEKIHAKDCEECETEKGMVDNIKKYVKVTGPLSDEQKTRLLEIGSRCPVHRSLLNEVKIETQAL